MCTLETLTTKEEETAPLVSNEDTDLNSAVETLLVGLIASSECSRWEAMSVEDFKACFRDAQAIKSAFSVTEMRTMLSLTRSSVPSKMTKTDLVNIISVKYGNGSVVPKNTTPKSLKTLSSDHVKSWSICAINVAFAQLNFPKALDEWENDNIFKGHCTIQTDSGQLFQIQRWYAQPARICGRPIQPIIDPHHIFVNNRARCCAKGMHGMNIKSEAWWRVAEESHSNATGLSLEIAKELRDRQNNSFAQTTFSQLVEREMISNGDHDEANWCRLIRNWYRAIDEAALSVDQRIVWMLEMRNHLLKFLRIGQFPPPGADVGGLPMAQFEGILSNVDRRLQLYALVKDGTYNQRAVTSLDSETFFSAFQDYDPKGSGVLRPDDIPTAMGAAVSLFNQRLNNERLFYMKTSTRTRVYPQSAASTSAARKRETSTRETSSEPRHILARSHYFDTQERRSRSLKRKSGTISRFGAPGKGAEGARAYHKLNEEKILPHRRFGIKDDYI